MKIKYLVLIIILVIVGGIAGLLTWHQEKLFQSERVKQPAEEDELVTSSNSVILKLSQSVYKNDGVTSEPVIATLLNNSGRSIYLFRNDCAYQLPWVLRKVDGEWIRTAMPSIICEMLPTVKELPKGESISFVWDQMNKDDTLCNEGGSCEGHELGYTKPGLYKFRVLFSFSDKVKWAGNQLYAQFEENITLDSQPFSIVFSTIEKPELITPTLDNEFQLKKGQTAFIESENLKIKFLTVTDDSRCSSDLVCKRTGSVSVLVDIIGIHHLSIGDKDESTKIIRRYNHSPPKNYAIKLVKVEPYPQSGIKKEDIHYVATFIVSSAPEDIKKQDFPREVNFELILKSEHCQYKEKKSYLIKDIIDWEKLWQIVIRQPTIIGQPTFWLPEVDFTKEMIVAVFMGEQSTGGYGIEVIKIIEQENSLEVFIKETLPAVSQPVTAVLTQPCHIIKLPKIEKEVLFKVGTLPTVQE